MVDTRPKFYGLVGAGFMGSSIGVNAGLGIKKKKDRLFLLQTGTYGNKNNFVTLTFGFGFNKQHQ